MSNWDRRGLMDLAEAIRGLVRSETTTPPQKALLLPLLRQADSGSKTVQADQDLLLRTREQVCKVCSEEHLCHCEGGVNSPHACRFLSDVADRS